MSDDVILQYVKSIDEKTTRIETAVTLALTSHQADDNNKHGKIHERLDSLERTRFGARICVGTMTLGGTGFGMHQLGMIDKFLHALSGPGVGQ